MTTSLKRFQELEAKVDRLERELSKAEGAYEDQLKRLKKERGCSSLAEASKRLKSLEKQEIEKQKEFTEGLEEFEGDWSELLEEAG